jgi:hypothetical protein
MTYRCELRDAHIPGGEWATLGLPRNTVESAKRDAKEHHRFVADRRGQTAYRIVSDTGAVVATCEPTPGWRLRWRWTRGWL